MPHSQRAQRPAADARTSGVSRPAAGTAPATEGNRLSEQEAFAGRPDPRLGGLLRAYLDRDGGHEEFAARIIGRLGDATSSWDVLARWARPGIAAAVLAAALAGYWLVLREDRLSTPELVGELAATDHPLDRDALIGDVLGTGR